MYEYNAQLQRVIDGDTIEVAIDLGFGTHRMEMLRLAGINAPEMRGASKEDGEKAKAFLEEFLPDHFVVRTQQDKKEKYGRYLAEVIAYGQNVNVLMINSGLAVPYMTGK
jgi:micrococcal nuclease